MQTSTVKTQAQGVCVIERGEHVRGTWQQNGHLLPFEYVGIQDREYSKQNDQWVSAPRGEQSDILIQVERLLQFDEFEYQGTNGVYTYHFKANIPFLAPGRWKEMIGVMDVSKQTFLPIKIWAGLPDSSVSWTIELFDYNKKKSIETPRVPWSSYRIQGGGMDWQRSVKDRLGSLDIDHRLEQSSEGLIIRVPEYYTLEDIKSYLGNSTITVYRLTPKKEDAIQIEYLRGDKKVPLFCAETLFTQKDIKNISLKIDPAYRPLVIIKFADKNYFPPEIAVGINGVIQDVAVLDNDQKINTLHLYTNMHYFELQLLKASIMHTLPDLDIKTTSGDFR